MNTVAQRLIAKELYLYRWLILGGSIAGTLSMLVAAFGEVAFYVGALTWLTAIIATGAMLALYGVINERKEHSLLFVLSLPLSTGEYVRAKQLGLTLAFSIPWALSSVSAILLILLSAGIPDGMLPYTVLLCVFLLTNFAVLLCAVLHKSSEGAVAVAILVTNMAVSLYMFVIGGLPGLQAHLRGPVAVWNSTVWIILTVEVAVLALAFSLPGFIAARRRDFI